MLLLACLEYTVYTALSQNVCLAWRRANRRKPGQFLSHGAEILIKHSMSVLGLIKLRRVVSFYGISSKKSTSWSGGFLTVRYLPMGSLRSWPEGPEPLGRLATLCGYAVTHPFPVIGSFIRMAPLPLPLTLSNVIPSNGCWKRMGVPFFLQTTR